MKNNIESTFEDAKARITLSSTEKDFHRARLQDFIRSKRMPVPSPFFPLLSPMHAMRFAAVALLMVVGGSASAAFAADGALPGELLYAVKVRVSEPVQLALTFDPKAKAALEVSFVDERLKEVAQVSVEGGLDTATLAEVSDSLGDSIDAAQANIATLQEHNDDDTAFESASDLQATLAAHAKILEKVRAAVPSANVRAIASTIEAESDQTDALVASATDAIEDSAAEVLSGPSDSQQDNTADALAEIKAHVADALTSFDASDRTDVTAALDEISAVIAAAKLKDDAGDTKGAYLLYTDANQKITELQTVIEADQALQIDVIDASLNAP